MNSDGKLKNDTTIVSCSISLKILKEDSEIESPMCSKLKLKKNKNSNIITKKKSTLTIPCQEKWKWITNKLRGESYPEYIQYLPQYLSSQNVCLIIPPDSTEAECFS
uniref:Uncharacterized protein n=1 Tax=Cacopsylla melanoneura TaxID=428564 RepID=A0A8D8ZWD9_9HEMI